MAKYFYAREDNKLIYNEYYLKYLIGKNLNSDLKNKVVHDNAMAEIIEVYGTSIRKVVTSQLVTKVLTDEVLKTDVLRIYDNVNRFILYYNYYNKMNDDVLLNILPSYFNEYNDLAMEAITILFNVYYRDYSLNDLILIYLSYVDRYNEYHLTLDKLITNINEDNYNLSLKYLFNPKLCNILSKCKLNIVKDIMNTSVSMLTLLFLLDYDYIVKKLISLENSLEDNIINVLNNIYKAINDREYSILSSRYGLITGKQMTLEEVGEAYSLTRERVRQIENKAKEKLASVSQKIIEYSYFLFNKLSSGEAYISDDVFYEYFNNKIMTRKILFLYSFHEVSIIYDHKLHLIYDKSIISKEEVSELIIRKLGKFINKECYDRTNNLEKCVIDNKYYEYKNDSYLLKGYRESEFLLDIIDRYYPNGYKVDNMEYHNRLNDIVNSMVGVSTEIPSTRSIATYFERYNYTLINRGLYKNRKYTVKMPDCMKGEVFKYIDKSKSNAIYYNELYLHFKDKLAKVGIDNLYYFKGVLDYELPSDIVTHRDYISINSNDSGRTTLINLYRSYPSIFTINDLKAKHPGIKEYTFYSVLAQEEENGLLFLNNRSFIYYDKLNLNDKIIKALKYSILDSFESANDNEISSSYLYNHISNTLPSLYKALDFMSDSYNLYSLSKYLFKDTFGFDRPFILKDKLSKKTVLAKIYEYIRPMCEVTYKDILNYCEQVKISLGKPFLYIVEDLSDEFVQTDFYMINKKSCLKLSDEVLNNIKLVVDDIIRTNSHINTKKMFDLNFLPKIEKEWNKYLLVGILRSYFNCYNIVKIDTTNLKSDYLITLK